MASFGFQELIDSITTYRNDNEQCTKSDLRTAANTTLDRLGYLMTFNEALDIDEYLFGSDMRGNTHWLEPFNNPDDGQIIARENEEYVARDCGIFTFKLV